MLLVERWLGYLLVIQQKKKCRSDGKSDLISGVLYVRLRVLTTVQNRG